ncbi:hypothetical protein PIIN_07473 [Serendipita indica DSM 11827]|uniref:Uncharacterized protein n=1 Tax=Serendipita indica (strain DSM 11827) TaxID=1109443 RepID=G4TQC7_SERID|nr:hypothetical protein PIIN_07473 [Serendipita indica DSM 11827]
MAFHFQEVVQVPYRALHPWPACTVLPILKQITLRYSLQRPGVTISSNSNPRIGFSLLLAASRLQYLVQAHR